MYCGSCLQGNVLVGALSKAGVDAMLLPMYMPVRTDQTNHSLQYVAYGGVNVYLQQRWSLFQRTPWLVDHLLDRPALLRCLSRWAGTTQPGALGPLTVSMLQGEEGRQRKELAKLLHILGNVLKPDLVHLNNALLAGVAPTLRHHLNVPVVCSLTGEDAFLDQLPSPHREQAWQLLGERMAEVDVLMALSRYYADVMAERLCLPRGWINVVPPGLDCESQDLANEGRSRLPEGAAFRVGFFSRIAPEKGLHLLAEAVTLLAKDPSLPPVELHAGGYLATAERPYLAEVERLMAEAGLKDRFHYHGAPDYAGKMAMLKSFDAFCLPTLLPESKGLPALEAWAVGVPAVLPNHGAFVELIAETRGGLLHEPGNAALLADGIATIIGDPEQAEAYGWQAQMCVHQRYNESTLAARTIELYRKTLDSHALSR